jgi:type I restriction enzyme R subunit
VEWLKEDSLRTKLTKFPALDPTGLRDCQVNAITNLEQSLANAKPRALVQMATGSGKTFTAITSVYRSLKPPVRAKRILFLVDTKNLGKQAEQEFQSYTPNDDRRKFTELYAVQRLSSNFIDPGAQVCISTIQRMYSILQGEAWTRAPRSRPAASGTRARQAAARAGGLQCRLSAGVLRPHRHRRVPPQHLQPVAAGAGVLRCLPGGPHRHAGQPHLSPSSTRTW